jgi:Uma2 family endonuclease
VVFLSEASLDSGRIQLIPKAGGAPDRYIELEGPPDLVVEIVSDSSVRKDTKRLPAAYFQAGVPEFWLIDARGDKLYFRIHRRGPDQYEPAEVDADGYQHSGVLPHWYRLDRGRNARGRLVFDLRSK